MYTESTDSNEDLSAEDLSKKKQTPQCQFSYNKTYCRTQYMTNTTECNWEIIDFWKLCRFMKTFISMPFPYTEQAKYQIRIEIKISFLSEGDMIIGFYILTKNEEFGSYYSICQIGPKGEETLKSESSLLHNMMLLYETKISTLKENSYIDLLKMNFKFEIFFQVLNTTVHTKSLSFSALKNLLESEKLIIDNDSKFDGKELITFIIDGKDYSISKNLLYATNSSYFKILCNTKDISDKIIITDKPDVFKDILSFIINDSTTKLDLYVWEERIQNSKRTIEDFLIIANKYDIQNLKFVCEQILLQNITIDNSLKLMQIAMQTNAEYLKKCVAGFIKFHIKFLRNKKFLSLPKEQINEIIEIINKLEVSEHVVST